MNIKNLKGFAPTILKFYRNLHRISGLYVSVIKYTLIQKCQYRTIRIQQYYTKE